MVSYLVNLIGLDKSTLPTCMEVLPIFFKTDSLVCVAFLINYMEMTLIINFYVLDVQDHK